nr:four-helix bundle copper-binding protein [Rhizobium cellulosilyticum]
MRTATVFKPTTSDTVAANAHIRLMLACAEMCRTSAHFMILETPHHKHTCKECAEICLECAAACEKTGGMQDCVDACRACAESCSMMAA